MNNADSHYGHKNEFDCHFFDCAKRTNGNSGADIRDLRSFKIFSAWMDQQLQELEREFESFATPKSNREFFAR